MKIVLYGTKSDKTELEEQLSLIAACQYRSIGISCYSDYDSFIAGLRKEPPNCIVITINGADGMEGVIAAKNVCKDVPVLWFSDDNGFGAQSYRLGCAYFHKKPVSPQVLSAAIARCV